MSIFRPTVARNGRTFWEAPRERGSISLARECCFALSGTNDYPRTGSAIKS